MLDHDQKREAAEKWRAGASFRAIALEMGIALGTLARWAVEWRAEDEATRARKTQPERPRHRSPKPDPERVPDNVVRLHDPDKPVDRAKRKAAGDKGGTRTDPQSGTRTDPQSGTRTGAPGSPPSPPPPPPPMALAIPKAPPPLVGVTDPDLTREIIDALVIPLREGNYRTIAEKVTGLPGGIVQRWMARANRTVKRLAKSGAQPTEREAIELDLLANILYAEAFPEAAAVASIQAIALRSPDEKLRLAASIEFLKRKAPERWGDRREITVEGGERPLRQQHQHLHASVKIASTEDMLARMDLAFADPGVVLAQFEGGDEDADEEDEEDDEDGDGGFA